MMFPADYADLRRSNSDYLRKSARSAGKEIKLFPILSGPQLLSKHHQRLKDYYAVIQELLSFS